MFPPREALYQDYVGVFDLAALAYETRVYGGKITFLWVGEEPRMAPGWQPVVNHKAPTDIEDHFMEGGRTSGITDHIDGVAEALSGCLSRLEPEPGPTQGVDQQLAVVAGPTTGPGGPPSTPGTTDLRDDGSDGLQTDGSGSSRGRGASPSFRIRRLRGRDLGEVLSIERRAFSEDPWTTTTARGWLARSPFGRRPRSAVRLAQFMRLGRVGQVVSAIRLFGLVLLGRPAGSSCVVAETGGAIVGYARISVTPGGTADVQSIAVESDHQGEGIGRSLLLDRMTAAAGSGCGSISLYVRADNPRALGLYRRVGFIQVGTLPGYYQPSGTDAIMMRFDFDDPGATSAPGRPPA